MVMLVIILKCTLLVRLCYVHTCRVCGYMLRYTVNNAMTCVHKHLNMHVRSEKGKWSDSGYIPVDG